MPKSLNTFDFISLREEREYYTVLSKVLEALEEAISRAQPDTISPGELARHRAQAIELLKQLELTINANNLEEAQRITIALHKIYADFLAPFKVNQDIAATVKANLTQVETIMRTKLQGVSTKPFEAAFPGSEKPASKPVEYPKNIGSGIIGANKVTFESKQ